MRPCQLSVLIYLISRTGLESWRELRWWTIGAAPVEQNKLPVSSQLSAAPRTLKHPVTSRLLPHTEREDFLSCDTITSVTV